MLVGTQRTILVLLPADALHRRDDLDLLPSALLLNRFLVPGIVDVELFEDWVVDPLTFRGRDLVSIRVYFDVFEAKLGSSLGVLDPQLSMLERRAYSFLSFELELPVDSGTVLLVRPLQGFERRTALLPSLAVALADELLSQVRVSTQIHLVRWRAQRLPVELLDGVHALEVVL